ncbi:hypothetical protein B23_1152 [Geobacillus thermoleovorans B23]|nr:hypothetical protein B23_1152 [Geobacillus thermoleovorans B23]
MTDRVLAVRRTIAWSMAGRQGKTCGMQAKAAIY